MGNVEKHLKMVNFHQQPIKNFNCEKQILCLYNTLSNLSALNFP